MRGRQPAAGRTPADVAEVHVTDALNAAHSEAAHDGPVTEYRIRSLHVQLYNCMVAPEPP